MNFSLPLIARMLKIPCILEINAPMAYESRRFSENWQVPFLPFWLEKMNIRLADATYVVSKVLKQFYIEHGIPETKIFVVPNGADVDRFHPGISPESIQSQYGLQEKTVVGFIGSFHYWHGLDQLTHYIRRVLQQAPASAFLLVGSGPLKNALQEQLKTIPGAERVILPGYVPHAQIVDFLAAMDIVIAPYPKLDFFYYSPLKIFEYLASGKAVIASRIGQVTEIIEDGKTGILVEPDQILSLEKATLNLIADAEKRKMLGSSGSEFIKHNYTWLHSAQRIIDMTKKPIS